MQLTNETHHSIFLMRHCFSLSLSLTVFVLQLIKSSVSYEVLQYFGWHLCQTDFALWLMLFGFSCEVSQPIYQTQDRIFQIRYCFGLYLCKTHFVQWLTKSSSGIKMTWTMYYLAARTLQSYTMPPKTQRLKIGDKYIYVNGLLNVRRVVK